MSGQKSILLLSGSLGKGYEQLYDYFVSCRSIINEPISLQDSMENAEQLLLNSSRDITRFIKLIS